MKNAFCFLLCFLLAPHLPKNMQRFLVHDKERGKAAWAKVEGFWRRNCYPRVFNVLPFLIYVAFYFAVKKENKIHILDIKLSLA